MALVNDDAKFFIVALKEEARTALCQVGSSADPEVLVDSVLEEIRALAPRHDGSDDRSEDAVWTQIRELLIKAAYATRPYCIRCGTCCTKGSPTLTRGDMEIFREDVLMPDQLATIRIGETVRDNRTGMVGPSPEEIIKIKGKTKGGSCILYDEATKTCGIYESRPRQCHLQECWNPDLSAVADEPTLNRRDLLEKTGDLWKILQRHEERCSHEGLRRSITRLEATRGQSVDEVMDILRFDHHVRQFVSDTFGLAAGTLDFVLGRPLVEVISEYGLRLDHLEDGSFFLRPLDREK